MICEKCGGLIKEDEKYCPHCGEELDTQFEKKGRKSIIPGFRTNKRWKKVLAVFGYICFAFVLLASSSPYDYGNERDKIIQSISGIISMIILLGIPFVLATNFLGIRHKLPLFKRRKIFYTILGSFFAYMLIGTMLLGVEAIASGLYSEEYYSDMKIAEEKRIAEEKAAEEKAAKEKVAEEKAAKEKAAEEKAAKEKVAKEKAAKEKAAKEKAAEEKAAKEKAAEEKAAKEKAAKEKAAKEKAAKEKAEKEKATKEEKQKEKYTIEDYVADCTFVELEMLARNPEKYVGKHIMVEGRLSLTTIFDYSLLELEAWTPYALEVEYDGIAYDRNYEEVGNIITGDYGYVAGEFLGDKTIRAAIIFVK